MGNNREGRNGCSFYYLDEKRVGRVTRTLDTYYTGPGGLFTHDSEFVIANDGNGPWTSPVQELPFMGWDELPHIVRLHCTRGTNSAYPDQILVTVEVDHVDAEDRKISFIDWDNTLWTATFDKYVPERTTPGVTLKKMS